MVPREICLQIIALLRRMFIVFKAGGTMRARGAFAFQILADQLSLFPKPSQIRTASNIFWIYLGGTA